MPPVGPWWYMPFAIQFYCFWPLLRRLANRFGRSGLLMLSMASLALMYFANPILVSRWAINLLETPLGHLPEACLGIAVARYNWRPGRVAAAAAALVFLMANYMDPFWLLSFISGLVVMVWAYQEFRDLLRRSGVLLEVGTYSTALFLVNGFVRFPFVKMATPEGWSVRLMYGVVSVATSVAVAMLLTAVVKYRFRFFPELAPVRPESGWMLRSNAPVSDRVSI